jgi:hypothetical protein
VHRLELKRNINTWARGGGGGGLSKVLYIGIQSRTAGMGQLFDRSNISMGCNFHLSVISMGR